MSLATTPDPFEVLRLQSPLMDHAYTYILRYGGNRFYRATQGVSVCLSDRYTRALWQNKTTQCGYFDTTRKGNHSNFQKPTTVGGRYPLLSEISAQSDPPHSKKTTSTDFSI